MLFTEHDMDVVFGHADRVLVLNRGELIAEGDAAGDPRGSRGCSAVYLGTGAIAEARGDRRMLDSSIGLDAAYGRAHVLFGVSLRASRPARCWRCSAATAPARSRRLKSLIGLIARRAAQSPSTAPISPAGALPHRPAGLGYVPEERRIFTD